VATCKACGGDNGPGAARCQYCDQPLADVRVVELDWELQTAGGATGRGRVKASAPAGAPTEGVRAAVEAAFGAAVTTVGADAGAARIAEAMRARLPALLPPGHTLESLDVTSVSAFVLVGRTPGGATAPRPASGGGCPLGCVALALSLCCITSGLAGGGTGIAMEWDVARLRSAKVVTPAEAKTATGLVTVQAATATIDSDLLLGPDGTPCLWLREDRPQGGGGASPAAEHVEAFHLGPLEVRPGRVTTSWDQPEQVRAKVDGETVTYSAIRADKPVTVVGTVEAGVLQGDHVYVSTRPSAASMADGLAEAAQAGRIGGLVSLLLGALGLFAWWRVTRRVSRPPAA
jgi:hypothetical protein